MKNKRKINISAFLLVSILLSSISLSISDVVCDLELLLLELKQDLDDNNILDCLRIIKPPSGVIETPEQMNKRLSAQWDSSCSFESTADWFTKLKTNFGISTLVDEIGEPVEQNNPEQADMCEIVRSLLAAGKFKNVSADLTNIDIEFLTALDCPGNEEGPKICAVNGISIYKKDMWTILLDSSIITIDDKPLFSKTTTTKSRFVSDTNTEIDDPGIPVNREEIKALSRISNNVDQEMQDVIARAKDFTKQDNIRPSNVERRVSLWYSTFKEENIIANSGWKDYESGRVDLKVLYESYIFVYHMVSGYSPNSRLVSRLLFDEVNMVSSRMMCGFSINPSLTTGFITKTQVGTHVIKTQYRTNNNITIDLSNKDSDNIITGVIMIPFVDLKIKKIINPEEVQLFNSNNPSDFPNLNASFKLNKTAYVLISYSISMPGMESHIVTNVEINNNSVFESRGISGDSTYWSIHNTCIVQLMADVDYRVKIKYRSPYPARTNPKMNDWESQSMTILQLPDWFNMQSVNIEEEFTLSCDGSWNLFPKMDIDLELEDNKSILFMYNVVLPLVNKNISIGIFLNDILDVRGFYYY